jgi:hypothetical protein
MNPVTLIVLICSANIPNQDCRPENALDIIRGPAVANEPTCGLRGRTIIAATEMRPRFGDAYVKILCTRPDPLRGTAQLHEPESVAGENH